MSYNKSEIMRAAWANYREQEQMDVHGGADFSHALKIAWREAKAMANVNLSDINAVATATGGKVWYDKIFYNGNFGSIFYDFTRNFLNIKSGDMNAFNRTMLIAFLDEKASQLQSMGLKVA